MSESPTEFYRIPQSPEDEAVVRARIAASQVTPEKLSEWKALCERATPEPWQRIGTHVDLGEIGGGGWIEMHIIRRMGSDPEKVHDLNFVAESRTALPACIAEIERLQKESREWMYRCERLVGDNGLTWDMVDAISGVAGNARVKGVLPPDYETRIREALRWMKSMLPPRDES